MLGELNGELEKQIELNDKFGKLNELKGKTD